MNFRRALLATAIALPVLITATPQARPQTPASELAKAPALYYIPTKTGLKGFHCDVDFDWASFFTQVAGKEPAASDAAYQYLRGVRMTVQDDLHTGGSLTWTPPTAGTSSPSAEQMKAGIEQMWSGFFQAWNVFLNGNVVTVQANVAVVTRANGGYHVTVNNDGQLVEEQYDDKLLLLDMHVKTPQIESTMKPSFAATPQGLLVNRIDTSYQQPGGPSANVMMRVEYAPVQGFILPSLTTFHVDNAGDFKFMLKNCTPER